MLYQTNIKDTGQNFSLYPIAVPPLHCGKTSLQLLSFFVTEPTRSFHHCKDAHLAREVRVSERWIFNFPPEALHAEHRLLGRAEHCERLVVKLTLERKCFKTNRGWISPSDATPSPSCSCGSRRAGETSLTRASRLDKVRTTLGLKHLNPLDAEGF